MPTLCQHDIQSGCNGLVCAACLQRVCEAIVPDGASLFVDHKPLHKRQQYILTGQAADRLLILVAGTAAICTSLPDGRRQIIEIVMAGDVVCGLTGISCSGKWLEAFESCTLCCIDLTSAGGTIKDEQGLFENMLAMAHRRLERANTHAILLGRMDGMERVCLFLADMAIRKGTAANGGYRVSLPFSREDIADYLGLNTETVSRLMSRVRKSKLAVFLSPTEYYVADITALQRRVPIPIPDFKLPQNETIGSLPREGFFK